MSYPSHSGARDGRTEGCLLALYKKTFPQSPGKVWLGGVVGWCEGAVYLTSPGRPTDIGLQLGKTCYPCSG